MQTMMSTILKSHGKVLQAVFTDGLGLLITNIYVVSLLISGGQFSFDVLQTLHTIYLFVLMGIFGFNWWSPKNDFTTKRYGRAIVYARPVVIASILVIGLTGSARILAEFFFGVEAVGYYSFYLRFATLTVMLQQVFIVSFFKRIYQSDPAYLDKYFAGFIAFALAFSLLCFGAIPYLFWGKLTILTTSFYTYKTLYLTLCLHTVLWTAMALNENVIYREDLSLKMNILFGGIIALMLIMMFGMHYCGLLTLLNFTIINALALFTAVETQHFILHRYKQINFKNMNTMVRFSLIVFVLVYFFI